MIFNQLLFIKAKLLTKFQILVQSNTNKPFSTSQFSPNSFLNLKPFSILLSWTFSLQSSWRTVYYLNPTSQVQIHIPSNTLSLYNPSKTSNTHRSINIYVPQNAFQNLDCYTSLNIIGNMRSYFCPQQKWSSCDAKISLRKLYTAIFFLFSNALHSQKS